MDELQRLRAPEMEVWVRLRPPTLRETVGLGLSEDIKFSDGLLDLCRWITDQHAEATWDWDSDDLRRAAQRLIEMVTPVLDDREEVARRIDAWASEWSLT